VSESCTLRKVRYELRFAGISDARRNRSFPCDERGHVDIDELSDRGRTAYFYARTVVGKELSAPTVAPVSTDPWSAEESLALDEERSAAAGPILRGLA
jgi:hypothetical protein